MGFAIVKLAQQMVNLSNEHYQAESHLCRYLLSICMLWQPLITKINSSTTSKSPRRWISCENHKRT